MKELIIYSREEKMGNLQYRVSVALTGCVIATATVLAVMDKIDAERYIMVSLALTAYWMPPPKNQDDKGEKD